MIPENVPQQGEITTIPFLLYALEVGSQKTGYGPALSEAVAELRSYLHSHYASVDLTGLDTDTFSKEKEKIAMQLQESQADRDVGLLLKMMKFYDALLAQPKEAADVIGVNLQDVRANTVNIQDVIVNVHRPDDPPAPGEEPYKGLQYFDVADAELFFGREKLTAELVDHLRRHSFLAVIGASGSGKSSLVRAGLVSALQKGEKLDDGSFPPDHSETWPVLLLTPTSRPIENLAEQLIRKFNLSKVSRTLENEMLHDPGAFLHAARQALDLSGADENRSPARRMVLVVDQFEEVFTLLRSDEQQSVEIRKIQQSYIDNLLHAATPDIQGEGYGSDVIVVLTLRADFYDRCGSFENLRQALESQQKYIGPMGQEELRQAIERSLQCFDWSIQPGLVDLLLYDIGKEPGALPLLSHALLETWKHRSGRTLTFAGYFAIGRVQGAIAKTADTTFKELSPQQQQIAKKIFLRLTEIGQGTAATRRRVAFSELVAEPSDERIVKNVLDILAEKRLITLNKDFSEQASTEIPRDDHGDENEEIVVEVAHEALIREWPTLQTWLRENRSSLRIHRSLTGAAEQWKERERDKSVLYRGARLSEATEWAKQYSPDMNTLERDFLSASQRAMWLNRVFWSITLILATTVTTLGVTGQLNKLIFRPLPIQTVLIEAGEFRMGSTNEELTKIVPKLPTDNGPDDFYDLKPEQPDHPVYLDDYLISVYETTNKQYYQCVKARVCSPPNNTKYANPASESEPVTDVNWEQARQFCEWNDALLPTEAQWEKAARGNPGQNSRIFPWGDYLPDPKNRLRFANVVGQIPEVRL